MKVCSICKIEKPIDEFREYNSKDKKHIQSKCRDCERQQNREYNRANKEQQKQYSKRNKEKLKEYKKDYYQKNKEKLNNKSRIYRQNNIDRLKQYEKEYKQRKKEHYREYFKEYNRKRKETDEMYKIVCQTRNTILKSFKRKKYTKDNNTKKILGCDFETFYNHLLESYKNTYNINYDFKTQVHIDHIIPLSTAITKEDIISLCHYTNLQLLNAKDNMTKGSKKDWKIGDIKYE